ncbi:hypothetical protein, partial [Vibrio parahaemolyticus]|uniref:hypothetical protein n=1 Tax=Vibrio parahaemolyticus TaxID=670 RepID=UPI0005F22740
GYGGLSCKPYNWGGLIRVYLTNPPLGTERLEKPTPTVGKPIFFLQLKPPPNRKGEQAGGAVALEKKKKKKR